MVRLDFRIKFEHAKQGKTGTTPVFSFNCLAVSCGIELFLKIFIEVDTFNVAEGMKYFELKVKFNFEILGGHRHHSPTVDLEFEFQCTKKR